MSTQFTQKPWDASWNPWAGCWPVHIGCANCHARVGTVARVERAKGNELWTPNGPRKRMSKATFNAPLKWNKRPWVCRDIGPVEYACCRYCHAMRVLWGTLGDPIDPAVPVIAFADALDVVRRCDQLDWWIVTKRPGLILSMLNKVEHYCNRGERPTPLWAWLLDWLGALQSPIPPSHVRLGVSISDQPTADKLIPELLWVPAANYFVLAEPLLANIKFRKEWLEKIGVIIIGGETGPHARPCNIEWVRDIIAQCGRVGTKCYVKQLGANIVSRNDAGFEGETPREWPMDTHYTELDPMIYQGAPVRIRLRSRTGSDPAEWPEDLKVREI